MKTFPIIFLFFDGELTFVKAFKNRSDASMIFTSSPSFLNIFSLEFASFFLNSPLSMNTGKSLFPNAFFNMIPNTVESTPPEIARPTRFFPTSLFTLSIMSSISFSGFHFSFILQISMKFFNMVSPFSV